jgi:hypothetical protein
MKGQGTWQADGLFRGWAAEGPELRLFRFEGNEGLSLLGRRLHRID